MSRLLLATALALLPLTAAAQDRVLSVGGSVTEIVFALGQEGRLVGRDTTSTYPAAAEALPDVGYLRALSPEGVLSVSPDLILLEAGSGPAETLATLEGAGVRIVTIPSADSPESVVAKVRAVAAALGQEAKGAELSARIGAETAKALAQIAAQTGPKPRVLFVLGNSGGRLTGAGSDTSAAAIIALAGGVNAIEGFAGYKALTDEAVAAAAPDIILAMESDEGPGMPVDDPLLAHAALAATPAGQAKRLIRMPGMFLLGFGPRTPEAIVALNTALYAKGN